MKKITIEIEADDDAEADKLVRLLDGDKHIGSIRVEHIKA